MKKIKKILNNNAILITDENRMDYVWIGPGIGFNKRNGDVPDKEKVERRFIIDESQKSEDVNILLENISTDYLTLSIDIVEFAKEQLSDPISNAIYISLADHIANSIYLNKKGLSTGTELSWEVKKLYPKEYQIGKKAIKMIREQTGIEFNDFEIGNIALHFINAQMKNTTTNQEISTKIKDILTLVRIHNKIELDTETLSYDRFVTHLRFFFKRIDSRDKEKLVNPLFDEVRSRYPKSFETMKLIEEYLEVKLNQDEQLYLCLHIQKLIE